MAGADWFIDSAVWMARATGVSRVIIGATVVSVATTLPEFAVSVLAAHLGHPDVAVGNAVGSCIANVGLILGAVLLARRARVNRQVFSRNMWLLLAVTAMFLILSADGKLSRGDGLALLLFMAFYVREAVRMGRSSQGAEEDRAAALAESSWGRRILIFCAGAALVTGGSRALVWSGTRLAAALGVPELVVGLTLVAVGTSLPELVTAVAATIKGHQELSVGNVMGANVLDLTWVMGVAALVRPLPIAPSTRLLDLPAMAIMVALLAVTGLTGGQLSRREGLVLLTAYAVYLALLRWWFW